MASTVRDYLEHFIRFRDHYPAEHMQTVLAQVLEHYPADAAAHDALGRFCAQLGLTDQARRFHESAIEKSRAPELAAAARLGCGMVLKDMAAALLRQSEDHLHQALALRYRLVALQPDSPAALARCADVLAALGQADAAERLYHRADLLEPRNVDAALGLAALALSHDCPDEAARVLAEALGVHSRAAALLEALVGVYERQGRHDAVIDASLRLLKLNPYNPPVAQRLPEACRKQGWYEAAMQAHRSAPPPMLEPSFRRRAEALPSGPAERRRVHFVSFASGEAFERAHGAIVESALRRGATHALPWRQADLKATAFYEQHKPILDLQRGAGYWLWKPFIILQALLAAAEGDWVWYHDAGLTIEADVTPIIDWADAHNDGIMPGIYLPCYVSRQWTKRDCYVLMGCDEERYWNHCLIQPGWSFWRKSERSIRIVAEWLSYATDPRILTDYPNTCGLPNLHGFIDHRHDQAVFTTLFVKLGLKTFGSPADPLPSHPKDIHFLVERAAAFMNGSTPR